jgi:predicted DNA-binding WGR domain protein
MQQQPKPRWPLIVVSALFVVVAAIGVYAFLWDRDQNPKVIVREDPIADLLGWIPATDETRTSFAVWTPDSGLNPAGTPTDTATGRNTDLTLEPNLLGSRSPAQKRGAVEYREITSWVSAGGANPIVVMTANSWPIFIDGPDDSDSYRGVLIYPPNDDQHIEVATAFLDDRIIIANTVDQVKAAIDAATGKRESLAEDEAIASLLQTVAPSNALMLKDAAKHSVACAQGDESTVNPSGQYVAIAYGRIGEGGQPRTLVSTSFESEAAAAAAEAAYELGWQDGYVLAGNSGAPIANFATVNHVSQSGNLLIAELIDGREDGWTRAAIRFAQPVCEAVSESLPDATAATPEVDEPSALNRALASLPDPGMDGATLAVDLATASQNVGEFAPEDQNVRAEDIEAWLAALGPIPSFDAFPNDGAKLARWPETFGISLGSISAISEIHTSSEEETVTVLVGTWDSDVIADHLSQLGFPRTKWGEASIYTLTSNLEDPSHELNRAAGAMWSNVGIYGDRIFVSPSSSRLREILDIARGEQSAPVPPNGVYLRDRMLAGNTDVTMLEIAGREFMNDHCIDLGDTGVAPAWYGAAALWKSSVPGGTGEMLIVPGDDQSIADAQQTFDRQITRNRTLISADSEPSGGSFGELFGYQEMRQVTLADGTTALVATFSPPAGQLPTRFFIDSVEGCRFGSP